MLERNKRIECLAMKAAGMRVWQPASHQLMVTVRPHWFYWLGIPLLLVTTLIFPALGIGFLILQSLLTLGWHNWSLGELGMAIGGLLLVVVWVALFGVLILLASVNREWVRCEFNRHTNLMTLHRRRLIGARWIQQPLHQIRTVRVKSWRETRESTDSRPGWRDYDIVRHYQVQIALKEAEAIPLTTYTQLNPQRSQWVAEQIRQFLGVT